MKLRSGFHSLPPEIILTVMDNIADLETLATLVKASSLAWRCFGTHGIAIAERVLSKDPMHERTKEAIRTISYIREGRLPAYNLLTFQRRVACYGIRHRVPRRARKAFKPRHFPEGCSPTTIRGILMTAHLICFRTVDCIDYYMTRFRTLQPKRPIDGQFRMPEYSLLVLRRLDPEFRIVKPPETEPPLDWEEEADVTRAFWRCQLIYDLKHAVRSGVITNWNRRNVDKLMAMTVPEVYDMERMTRKINYAEWALVYRYCCLYDSEMAEHELVLTVIEYLQHRPRQHLDDIWCRPAPPPPREEWHEAKVCRSWCSASRIYEATFGSPLVKQIDFAIYRGYGFAIWSHERLTKHGFWPTNYMGYNILPWTSILDEQEIERIEAWERTQPPPRYASDSEPDS